MFFNYSFQIVGRTDVEFIIFATKENVTVVHQFNVARHETVSEREGFMAGLEEI